MTKKRYIILARNVFSKRDWDRLGCDMFQQHEYEVLPVNCSNIIFTNQGRVLETEKNTPDPRSVRADTVDEVVRILKACGPDDFILMLLQLQPSTQPIYAMIGRRKLKYVVQNLAILPYTLDLRDALAGKASFAEIIEDIHHRLYRMKVFISRLLSSREGYFHAPAPTWWVRSGCAAEVITSEYPKMWKAEVLPANSYAQAEVQAEKSTAPNGPEPDRPETNAVATFIDIGAISHPEWLLQKGGSPVDPDRYFSTMRRVFDLVEERFGLTVIVAAHPRVKYRPNDPCFGGREIHWGQTDDLIKKSQLVLNHHGTSISSAVRYRRPVIFLTNNDFEKTRYRWWSFCMHSWLGQPRINIDNEREVAAIEMRPVDEARYKRYEEYFLVERDAPLESPWRLLLERFEATLAADGQRSESGNREQTVG